MENPNKKKICPLLTIAQTGVGGAFGPALCVGNRCAFCTIVRVCGAEYMESCVFVDMADGLRDLAVKD